MYASVAVNVTAGMLQAYVNQAKNDSSQGSNAMKPCSSLLYFQTN